METRPEDVNKSMKTWQRILPMIVIGILLLVVGLWASIYYEITYFEPYHLEIDRKYPYQNIGFALMAISGASMGFALFRLPREQRKLVGILGTIPSVLFLLSGFCAAIYPKVTGGGFQLRQPYSHYASGLLVAGIVLLLMSWVLWAISGKTQLARKARVE